MGFIALILPVVQDQMHVGFELADVDLQFAHRPVECLRIPGLRRIKSQKKFGIGQQSIIMPLLAELF